MRKGGNMSVYMIGTIHRLIDQAEEMNMGYFRFPVCDEHVNDDQIIHDVKNSKIYTLRDFIDMVMHEKIRRLTMLER